MFNLIVDLFVKGGNMVTLKQTLEKWLNSGLKKSFEILKGIDRLNKFSLTQKWEILKKSIFLLKKLNY